MFVGICSMAYTQGIDSTFNQTNFTKAIKEANTFSEWKNYFIGFVTVVILAFSALARFWKTLLESVITKVLADKLQVKKENLEDMLKDYTKEFDVKTNRKIHIISSISDPTIASVRNALIGGGFKSANLEFNGINDATINLKEKDVVLFNDKFDSSITVPQMEDFISKFKVQITSFFYFGAANNLPLDDWKKNYSIKIGSANLPDRLVPNLINFFKTT